MVDAVIAGAGPTGMLTALLARAKGFDVLVAEAGGVVFPRPQLARFAGETQKLYQSVGAGRIFPPFDSRSGFRSMIAPIRDAVADLRAVGADGGLQPQLRTSVLDARASGAGVRISLSRPDGPASVEARVLLDASGGSLHRGDPRLGLQHAPGTAHAIGLEWSSVAGGALDPDALRRIEVAAAGIRGVFHGHADATHGAFGVLELPTSPTEQQADAVVDALRRATGIAEEPSLRSSFSTQNRIVASAVADGVALLGDAVSKLRPTSGQGLNIGALDATDAVRLLERLRSIEADPASTYGRMQRELAFDQFNSSVMGRHRSALKTDLAQAPGLDA